MADKKTAPLTPDEREALIEIWADIFESVLREHMPGQTVRTVPDDASGQMSGKASDPVRLTPWLTAPQAAKRAQVGQKTIYAEVRAGRLRAARVGGKRELRFRPEWIDKWLEDSSQP